MKVTLLHYTPLWVAAHAIRTCWQSFDKSDNGGEKDKELIDRVGNKYKHASTLEHLVYTFYIQGISRAVLQELARHRMASLSVKSTRYTLKELKNEEPFLFLPNDLERAGKYVVMTGDEYVDKASMLALNDVRNALVEGKSNDIVKYILPESYKTELTWTVNMRSLQSMLGLRLNKSALWEFQDLCCQIVQALPKEHLFLVEDTIKEQIKGNGRIAELVKVFD
jgi:thymidylate synthase (FAD)